VGEIRVLQRDLRDDVAQNNLLVCLRRVNRGELQRFEPDVCG
jgi:hypothetical protein